MLTKEETKTEANLQSVADTVGERAAERHAARTPEKEAVLREYWSKKVEGSATLKGWKEKYKDCNATPKNDKSLFRTMGDELAKSSLRKKWETRKVVLENAYTKSITISKDALDCLIYHAFTKEELDAIVYLTDNLNKLKNAKYLFINMHRKNYKKKIMDGVQHMVSYNLTHEGKEFEFKTEVIKRKSNKHNVLLEIPYSLKRK